ncbi:MAG: hypothetical protein KC964_13935 [Candidatus Omnitrophica bacterium]|nr:hypothetical protein [Candidatus Omnitrophota bacterium]
MRKLLCCILLFCMTAHADPSYDLTDGWKFKPDSDNVGTEQEWFAPFPSSSTTVFPGTRRQRQRPLVPSKQSSHIHYR